MNWEVTPFPFADKDIKGYVVDHGHQAVNLKVRPGSKMERDFFHLSSQELSRLIDIAKNREFEGCRGPFRDNDLVRAHYSGGEVQISFRPNVVGSFPFGAVYLTRKELEFLRDLLTPAPCVGAMAAPAVTSIENAVAQLKLKVDQFRHEAGQYFQARNYKLAEATNELAASIEKALKEHAQNTANS